jgi:hypothetical protein
VILICEHPPEFEPADAGHPHVDEKIRPNMQLYSLPNSFRWRFTKCVKIHPIEACTNTVPDSHLHVTRIVHLPAVRL